MESGNYLEPGIQNPESGIIEIENDDRKKLTSALSNK